MSTEFDSRILRLTDRLDLLRDSLKSPLVISVNKRAISKQIQTLSRDLEKALEMREAERQRIAALRSGNTSTASTARLDTAPERHKKL
jgi:hypothetical protein